MRTFLLVGGLIAGLVAGAISIAPTVAQDATPVGLDAAGPGDGLTFEIRFNDTFVLQDEAAGLQLGDRIILSDDLLRDGEVVGHNGGVCTVTDVEGELLCLVTFSLPEGTISIQFLNTPPPDKVFAITGGTGAYENARGHGELTEHGDGTGTVTFYVTD